MKTYLLRISIAVAAALVALLLFGTAAVLLGRVQHTATAAPATAPAVAAPASALPAPMALRAISVPFGISDILTVSVDGGQLLATGHAVCWEDGQMFDLRVRVAQSTTNAFAEARTIDICANGQRQMWDAAAATQSIDLFAAGGARACAEATEFGQHGIVDEHRWCKDIELAMQP